MLQQFCVKLMHQHMYWAVIAMLVSSSVAAACLIPLSINEQLQQLYN